MARNFYYARRCIDMCMSETYQATVMLESKLSQRADEIVATSTEYSSRSELINEALREKMDKISGE
jgi:metal-responsive CopG/Arc/MetJ family transcriptional regulator